MTWYQSGGYTDIIVNKSDTPVSLMKRYHLTLRSHLGIRWLGVLPIDAHDIGLDTAGRPITMLTVSVVDQSELIGLLNELHDLGIQLVAINALEIGEGGRFVSTAQAVAAYGAGLS